MFIICIKLKIKRCFNLEQNWSIDTILVRSASLELSHIGIVCLHCERYIAMEDLFCTCKRLLLLKKFCNLANQRGRTGTNIKRAYILFPDGKVFRKKSLCKLCNL